MKRKSLAFAILDSPFLIPLQRRAEAGYSMVVLIVAITVLNILVAAMLPLWSTQIRREKEEELIFRGWQYAEAIRLFSNRHDGQYPTKLEDLLKAKPRCIRQLWKDPMTEDGKWVLVFGGQQGMPPPDPNGKQSTGEDENGRPPQFGPREGEAVQVGPIIGVRSRSNEKSMLVFDHKQRYNEWEFSVNKLGGGRPKVGGDPTATAFQFSTRWLGRPMRFMDQLQGLPQDGIPPGGDPPDPNGRGGNTGGNNRNRRPPGSTKP